MAATLITFPSSSIWARSGAKQHVAKALAILVDDGVLTNDDAVRHARMILADNARRLHKLPAG